MEKELIRLYSEEGYSINKLCKKYRIGKLKVKKILNDNNLEISLILYPRKIIEELTNKNKTRSDIIFPLNFLYIK